MIKTKSLNEFVIIDIVDEQLEEITTKVMNVIEIGGDLYVKYDDNNEFIALLKNGHTSSRRIKWRGLSSDLYVEPEKIGDRLKYSGHKTVKNTLTFTTIEGKVLTEGFVYLVDKGFHSFPARFFDGEFVYLSGQCEPLEPQPKYYAEMPAVEIME